MERPDPAASERLEERQAMLRTIEALLAETASHTGAERLSPRVRRALERVPRHRFVPPEQAALAYADRALPIGHGQTISQPFIVALMTQLARPEAGVRALEVGTGCGYQAAVLAEAFDEVDSIEVVPELAAAAAARLADLGIDNVRVHAGDGRKGWPEAAPFDAILVTAATPRVPPALLEQLAPGGRVVVPLGAPGGHQELTVVEVDPEGGTHSRAVLPVAFVPLVAAG